MDVDVILVDDDASDEPQPSVVQPDEEERLLSELGLSNKDGLLAVLRDGKTGHLAYLVGTAHVSPQAATDVREVISLVGPDFVAVEMDAIRLANVRKALQKDMKPVPTTTWQVLKRVYFERQPFWQILFVLPNAAMAAILGVPYGADMLTAVKVADELGIKVVPIDRDARITLRRALDQWNAYRKEHPERVEQRGAFDKDFAMKMAVEQAEAAGCVDPQGSVRTLYDILVAAQKGQEISPSDLQKVRDCGLRVVEKIRRSQKPLHGSLEEMNLDAFINERDLILAHNLRRCTERGTTVGVVGSGHLAGIRDRWPTATSPDQVKEVKAYLSGSEGEFPDGPPKTPPISPIGIGALAATGALAYYRPRQFIRGALFIGGVGLGAQVGAAAMIARAGRAVERIRTASSQLAPAESTFDS